MPTPTLKFSPVNGTLQPGKPFQIWYGGSGIAPFVANNDFANTMYVGSKEDCLRQDISSTIPFYPLGGMALSDVDIWAFIPESATANQSYLVIPGATSWTPSPVQVELALNAAGLATAALQQTQQNTLVSGIGLPTGAARDSTIQSTNITLGSGIALPVGAAKDTSVAALGTSIPTGISTTGVPLLSVPNNLVNVGNTVIAAGGSGSQGPLTISQIGYEIFISVECNSVSTSPYLTVVMTWTDTASGRVTAIEQWDLAATSSAFQRYSGTGPTKGNSLTITLNNQDNVNSMTYVMSFTQNSRVYSRDDWRQQSTSTPPGFTNATMSANAGILAATGASIGAGGTNVRVISLYAGEATISISNAGQALAVTIVPIADPTIGLGAGSLGLVYSNNIAANGNANSVIMLPRSVCVMALTNGGASAMSPTAAVMMGSILD